MTTTEGTAESDEQVLRRFDDNRDDHWSDIAIDEADGSRHLKGGAFLWNPDLSVALTSLLSQHAIAADSVLDAPYLGLALADAADVRAFRSQHAVDPASPEFEIVADPQPAPPEWMKAHGLVRQVADYGGNKSREKDARRQLVRRVFKPIALSVGKLPEWSRLNVA